jgi:hypothetical protein
MTPEQIQRRGEHLNKEWIGAVGLLEWTDALRPIPWNESPAGAKAWRLKRTDEIKLQRVCLDLLDKG